MKSNNQQYVDVIITYFTANIATQSGKNKLTKSVKKHATLFGKQITIMRICNNAIEQVKYSKIRKNRAKLHCVKSVIIWSYSGLHFPAFGLNMARYFVSLRFQSECRKMRTRITPETDTFYAVPAQRLSQGQNFSTSSNYMVQHISDVFPN